MIENAKAEVCPKLLANLLVCEHKAGPLSRVDLVFATLALAGLFEEG